MIRPQLSHATLALSLTLPLISCSKGSGVDAPDILLISLDSVRADVLTFADEQTAPHLTELARRGTIFTQAISGTSWTLPSHLQMFSGLPPVLHGVQEGDLRLDPLLPTLPKTLKAAGYQTAGFFTCWYLAGEYGFADGFDLYANSMKGGEHLDKALAEAIASESSIEQRRHEFRSWQTTDQYVNSPIVVENAARALDEMSTAEPAFLFAHFFDPHFDYIPPAPFDTRFDPEYAGTMTGLGFWENKAIYDESKKPARQISDADLDHIRALYRAEIAWTDDAIGKLLARLEERGKLDNTLIIVTADHGEEFFEHGNRGHRRTLYDEVLRVPLLIVPPRGSSAAIDARRDEQVSLSDLFPTVLDYAGVEGAQFSYGRSLRPSIEGGPSRSGSLVSSLVVPVEDPRRGIGRGMWDSVRTPSEKLIRYWVRFDEDAKAEMRSFEYYDLVTDPGERRPIRTFKDKRVRDAWKRLEQEMEVIRLAYRTSPHSPAQELLTEIHSITVDDLADLGYAAQPDSAPADLSRRLGFTPLPPASITGGKSSE